MAYSGNGTGTQADPYQVTTIEQLVECFDIYNKTDASRRDLHMYCKLMNDLDFNNSPQYWDCPAELFGAKNMSYMTTNNHWVYIDGNGFGIYNLYNFNKAGIFTTTSSGSGWSNSIYINNCVLEAVVINSTNDRTNLAYECNSSYSGGIFFDNCDLRIKLYKYNGDVSDSHLFKFTRFNNCILNIDIIINKQGFVPKTTDRIMILSGKPDTVNSNSFRNFYNEWNIRIIFVSESDTTTNVAKLFGNTCHFFSSFFIEMVAVKANFVNKFYFGCDYGTFYTNINNCYFVVKNTSTTYKANLIIDSTVIKNGVNFYDSQLADGQITDKSGGSGELLALTTAQCKDAEYLEQQGFIIAK